MDRLESLKTEYITLYENVKLYKTQNITFSDFVWARSVVITRIFGFTINDNKTSGLVPFADLVDHSPKPRKVKWFYQNSSNGFVMSTVAGMKQNDEIYVTFGKKCIPVFL